MSLTITRLAMFRLLDGQGQALYVGAHEVALFVQGTNLLAHYRPYPQLVFLVTGWHIALCRIETDKSGTLLSPCYH